MELAKAEYWQFAGAAVSLVVVAILWLRFIYLPGRTLERRGDGGQGRDRLDEHD